MKKNILFNKDFLIIIFLFIFSSLINQYYGNLGAFPHDSFSHFETGFRILNGEHPFENFWIISGPFVDYLQGLFFYLFGVSWKTYVLHASILNGVLSIVTFIVLRNFNLSILYSSIYTVFFSILAYPSSGTPFVDHHSTFLSLLGIYSILLGIKKENIFYWIISPTLFIFAFLSKQVPVSYIIIPTILILSFYFIENKKYNLLLTSLLTSIFLIIFLFFFGSINGITLTSFLEQYIFYPQTVGQSRFQEVMNISIWGIVGHFKFILISLVPLIYINLKNFYLSKTYYKKNDFYYFLILFFFTFSLIFHQILTKNQTFIFFLIPILVAFSHIYLGKIKPIFNYLIIIFCLFITTKYHLRFNEGRKFHELANVNLKLSVGAETIDEKLSGLKWITPQFQNNPKLEVQIINEIKYILKNDKRKKMVLSNYPFLSVILGEQFFSPTRWHTFDGTDYPMTGNRYFSSYKNLLLKSIKKNNIEIVYIITPVKKNNLYNYINPKCFDEKKINDNISSFIIVPCKN